MLVTLKEVSQIRKCLPPDGSRLVTDKEAEQCSIQSLVKPSPLPC
jgi:hypothetical protein